MKKCGPKDYNDIIKYIGNDYYKCLYLLLDLKKYRFNNENVNVFLQQVNGKITAVILSYYTNLHIFSRDNDLDCAEIIHYILINRPTMICAEKKIIEALETPLSGHKYKCRYGLVRGIEKADENKQLTDLFQATDSDFDDITKLIMQDKGLGGAHTYETLYNQLFTRYKDGFCRNYVIKRDDKIIGHVCSGAEDKELAILTDLIVDHKYRGKGYGKDLCESFCKLMISEGKKVFLVNYTEHSDNLYKKLGFKVYCGWGKLYIESE